MKKVIGIILVCVSVISVYLTIQNKSTYTPVIIENNKTYDVSIVSVSSTKSTQNKATEEERKKIILKRINEINIEISKTLENSKIDILAKEKKDLQEEFSKFDGGES